MKRFVVGDIHGAYKALKQVIDLSKIDYNDDQLICLGDVSDGWSEVSECFDELLKFKNLIYIMGNHDEWLLDWFQTSNTHDVWTSQGGNATLNNYINRIENASSLKFIKLHRELLQNAEYYHVSSDNKLFIHGGFDWHMPIELNSKDTLVWDRDLFKVACMWQEWCERNKTLTIVKDYEEVFIGHTSTSWSHKDLKPVHASNVWNLDQGAGWEGKLTMMNVDSKEYWQSDIVKTLYPNNKGRF